MKRLLAQRWLRVALAGVVAAAAPVLGAAAPASAEPRISVTPARDLDPAGAMVRVRGTGYDESKGIYVAWCVRPSPGQKPTPCGGGQNRDGSSSGSAWVSSFPPAYGAGLAEPYGQGGSFEVQISVSRFIGEVDCFEVACAVTTRNDHERTEDRSQDAFAAVEFRGQEQATRAPTPNTGRAGTGRPPEGDGGAEDGTRPSRPQGRSTTPERQRPDRDADRSRVAAGQDGPAGRERRRSGDPDELDGAVVVDSEALRSSPRAVAAAGDGGLEPWQWALVAAAGFGLAALLSAGVGRLTRGRGA